MLHLALWTAFLAVASATPFLSGNKPKIARQAGSTLDCSQFRFVPALVNSSISGPSWITPPPYFGWGFGHFYLAYTSQQELLQLANIQTDFYPVLPTSNLSAYSQIELLSYQLPDNSSNSSDILTTYGVDSALTGNLSDYTFGFNASYSNGTVLEQDIFGWIGWGQDQSANGFFVVYDDSTSGVIDLPPALSIYSRAEGGPDNTTLSSIMGCISGLAGPDIKALASQLTKTTVDGRRTGLPPISCDATCQGNGD